MSYSEKVLVALSEIAARDDTNMFEAAAQYCEEHDLDPVEFAENLDKAATDQLRYAALKGRHVRKCVQSVPNELD